MGINCALGAAEMRPYVEELARIAPLSIACYPNAGLPNAFGGYDETPEQMAADPAASSRAQGWSTSWAAAAAPRPSTSRAIADAVAGLPPRRVPVRRAAHAPVGLEPLAIRPDSNFIVIGERTNVTGCKRFARLVGAGDYEEASRSPATRWRAAPTSSTSTWTRACSTPRPP